MKRMRIIYASVALMLMVAIAPAAVLLQDGFEEDSATMDFNSTLTYYPQNWTTTTGTTNEVMVYNVNAIGDAEKPPTVPQGVNALRMVNYYESSGSASPVVSRNWGSGNLQVEASFDIYMINYAMTSYTFDIRMHDSNGGIGVYLGIYQNASGGPDIAYNNGSAWEIIASNVATDAWKTMVINADAQADAFTLTYNDVTYDNGGNGYAFYSDIDDVGELYFKAKTATYRKYFLDNVIVESVPEPVTLGLISFGGLAAIGFKKRL